MPSQRVIKLCCRQRVQACLEPRALGDSFHAMPNHDTTQLEARSSREAARALDMKKCYKGWNELTTEFCATREETCDVGNYLISFAVVTLCNLVTMRDRSGFFWNTTMSGYRLSFQLSVCELNSGLPHLPLFLYFFFTISSLRGSHYMLAFPLE